MGGHGGAHVGTHDDAKALLQGEESRIDQAHGHNGGGAAGLQHGCNHCTQQNAHGQNAGHGLQDFLQLGTGSLLQAVAHELHTVHK